MALASERSERREALIVEEPQPLDVWGPAAELSTVGLFVLGLVTAIFFARPILMPVLAAVVIGTTCAPIVKLGREYGISPWITAIGIVLLMLVVSGLLLTLMAAPIAEWIARAPEIGANLREKLHVFDRPAAAIRELWTALNPSDGNKEVAVEASQLNNFVTPFLTVVTPAAVEIVLFVGTLIFFLGGQMEIRRSTALMFPSREAKLRFLRIVNDIESNLGSYVAVVTAINFTLGVVVALGAWLFGFPSPIIFGIVAMVLNYIPYIGAALFAVALLGVGLITFPSLGQGVVPAISFVALTTIEGQFITPTLLGRRLTLNPLVVFLALAFWAWLWGPIGAFLAVPFTVMAMVIFNHLFPSDDPKLPG